MIIKELDIESVSELKIHLTVWKPEIEIKAVVTLVHGLGEHCMRYTPYIEYFAAQGFAFVGFDLMGHGKSEGARGTITDYETLIDDVDICVMKTKYIFPKIPHFIYGHSMGGNIVLNYLAEYHPHIDGAIVTSPWLKLTNEPMQIARGVANLLSFFAPDFTISNGLNINHISHLPEEIEKYRTDPLNHGRISFLLFACIARHGKWVLKNGQQINIPVLLMHGSDDKITSPTASWKLAHANPEWIEWKEWPGKYHELHNEDIREKLAEKAMNWMTKKMPHAV